MSKQVKNRAPAPIQISAEHLIRESKERGLEVVAKAPRVFIADKEELEQYQQTKRQDFENQIRKQKQKIGTWTRYALWEASLKEYERARSVFERALDVDYRNPMIWLKYAEMEMKAKFVNHARNIWDRVVALLPRMDVFWYKYTYMEELVGASEAARQVFERWMKWEPDDNAWGSYIKFEQRQEQTGRCRGIFERYIVCHPTARAYLKYAKFEEKQFQKALARTVFERSLAELHDEEKSDKLLIQFARFEERCKEVDRARIIYQHAIAHCEANDIDTKDLKTEFLSFEKRNGSKSEIDEAILRNRRQQYEKTLADDPYNYDCWFDYIRLEEQEGDLTLIRAVYERAVAQVPPVREKKYWKRYIYLWISRFLFEELQAKDVEATRQAFKACLKVVPHKHFTFGKVWMQAAEFEVRQKDLAAARKILGQAVGMCGKENIFKGYIALEHQLGEIDRCRTLYTKYLEALPHNCLAWKAFAQMEASVAETARTRAIYELAITQPTLDMPEVLWKSYIDFEIAEGEADNVRGLYERLLERTGHVKVWISYGQFEALKGGGGGGIEISRQVFRRGYDTLKEQGLKEERVMLLEAWRECEAEAVADGQPGDVAQVDKMMPRKMKMRRVVHAAEGEEQEYEEYYDYQFPDDAKPVVGLKILEKALLWKQQMAAATGRGPADPDGSSTNDDSNSVAGRKRGLDE
jgi:crooked neck